MLTDCELRFSQEFLSLLTCPCCKSYLDFRRTHFQCLSQQCGTSFPIIDGIPVLINEANSIFDIADFVSRRETTLPLHEFKSKWLLRIVPGISKNLKAKANFEKFAEIVRLQTKDPNILIIGGCIEGQGIRRILDETSFSVIETDVSFGPRTMLICDAHDLPFADSSFDGIIIQAVLEHVLNPWRCVEEIARVLKPNGIVYAETPFMQQVHMGRYDFIRFTHLGHRRLFREFEEIDSGATGGPGMALAWSYQFFLLSFFKSNKLRMVVKAFARFTSFWLKYFDYYLVNSPGGLDGALGYYFLGKKSVSALPDKSLIQQYKGAQ